MGHRLPLDAQFVLLDYSADTRALLNHLRVEAPTLLPAVVLITPDARLAADVSALGIHAVRADPWDINAVLDIGVERARLVGIFPENPAGCADRMVRVVRALRRLCPEANLLAKAATAEDAARLYAAGATEVFVVGQRPSPAVLPGSLSTPPEATPRSGLLRRIVSWRFLTLVALAVLDGLVFFVPLGSGAVLGIAVIAPARLRAVARFLDALADGE